MLSRDGEEGGEMTKSKLQECRKLALDFNKLALDVIMDLGDKGYIITGTKRTGKLRRLSMDLTRALAELRAGK